MGLIGVVQKGMEKEHAPPLYRLYDKEGYPMDTVGEDSPAKCPCGGDRHPSDNICSQCGG